MVAQHSGRATNSWLIREGMEVVDAADERVGTVRRVYRGGSDPSAATVAGGAALDDLPDEPVGLRDRLATSGFVEIDTARSRMIATPWASRWPRWRTAGVRLAVGRDTLARK
jgi:hypothetical protein